MTILTDRYLANLEALLFIAGSPLEAPEIADYLDSSLELVQRALFDLSLRLAHGDGPLCLRRVEEGYQLSLKKDFSALAERYFNPQKSRQLSPQAYDVLAAVAYLQPATRAQVEAVRGVNSDHLIQRLREAGLIQEAGRADLPGRPQTFEVSQLFWQEFGYESRVDLPAIDLSMFSDLAEMTAAPSGSLLRKEENEKSN